MSVDTNVEFMDVLLSMAASLVERQPIKVERQTFQGDELKKAADSFTTPKKPPKEIFYRNTSLFLTDVPPFIQPRICSCRYLCNSAPAVIKCLSCSIYSAQGSGKALYCDLCFQSCHPWFRIPHIYQSIEQEESVDYTLKVAHRVAEATRYEREGELVLARLCAEKARLDVVRDDSKVDGNVRDIGRRVTILEEKMQSLRRHLKEDLDGGKLMFSAIEDDTLSVSTTPFEALVMYDIQKSNELIQTNEDVVQYKPDETKLLAMSNYTNNSAAHHIQRVYKGYLVRRMVSMIFMERIVRFWNAEVEKGCQFPIIKTF